MGFLNTDTTPDDTVPSDGRMVNFGIIFYNSSFPKNNSMADTSRSSNFDSRLFVNIILPLHEVCPHHPCIRSKWIDSSLDDVIANMVISSEIRYLGSIFFLRRNEG